MKTQQLTVASRAVTVAAHGTTGDDIVVTPTAPAPVYDKKDKHLS